MKSRNRLFTILSDLLRLTSLSALLLFSGTAAADYNSGVLKVVTEAEFPPFEFKGHQSNQFMGFDVDIITAAMATQGFKVEFVHTPFPKVLSEIVRGSADIAISAISITDARKALVHFSEPYYKTSQSVMIHSRYKDSIRSSDDLRNKSVCVKTNSTGHDYAIEVLNAKAVDFPSSKECFNAVLENQCIATISDKTTIEYFLAHNRDTEAYMLEEDVLVEPVAIVTAHERPQISKIVDDGLRAIRDDGTYDRIYEKWFGSLGFLLIELDM